MQDNETCFVFHLPASARLAQSAERKALNLVVVGSSPTVGVFFCHRASMGCMHVYHRHIINLHHIHMDLQYLNYMKCVNGQGMVYACLK